jgi:hypothetical protein
MIGKGSEGIDSDEVKEMRKKYRIVGEGNGFDVFYNEETGEYFEEERRFRK